MNCKKLSSRVIADAALVAALTWGAGAQGATVANLLTPGITPAGQVNTIHDVTLEYLQTDLNSNGLLDVGDVIAGYINFGQILVPAQVGLGIPSGALNNDELTGMFQIKVTGKTAVTGGFSFTFGPDPNFMGQGAGGGAMAALYSQGPGLGNGPANSNLTTTITRAGAQSESTDGALFWLLGFKNPSAASHLVGSNVVSNDGEGWTAIGGDAINLLSVSPGTQVGKANFTVNVLPSAGIGNSLNLKPQTLDPITLLLLGGSAGQTAQIVGSSTISGTRNLTGQFAADATTDITILLAPTVPLPSAFWGGLVLLSGVGLMEWKRRRVPSMPL